MTRPLTEDHADCGKPLDEPIAWFVANELTCPRPLVPHLRRQFGLSAIEAVEVLRAAALRRDWQNGGADADAS